MHKAYQNEKESLFLCADGKICAISLNADSAPEVKVRLCGISLGDSKEEVDDILGKKFEEIDMSDQYVLYKEIKTGYQLLIEYSENNIVKSVNYLKNKDGIEAVYGALKENSRIELKDMINLTEKEVATMFKMGVTEWGMYPDSEHPIFWCLDGKVYSICLSSDSDLEHEYELWGIVAGDNYEEALKKLESSFEKKAAIEIDGENKVVLLEKKTGNDLTLYYSDDGKIEYISYSIAEDEYMSGNDITEEPEMGNVTNSSIKNNYTETYVDNGLINQIQYEGTAGIVQILVDYNLLFAYEIYYGGSLPTTGEVVATNLERCTNDYFNSYDEYVEFVHMIYVNKQADYFIGQAKYFNYNGMFCLNTAFDSGYGGTDNPWDTYTIDILSETDNEVVFEVTTKDMYGNFVTRQGTMVDENGYWKLTEPVW